MNFLSLFKGNNKDDMVESRVLGSQSPPGGLFRSICSAWGETRGINAYALVRSDGATVTCEDTPTAALLNICRFDGLLTISELEAIKNIVGSLTAATGDSHEDIVMADHDNVLADEVSHLRRVEIVESNR